MWRKELVLGEKRERQTIDEEQRRGERGTSPGMRRDRITDEAEE